MSRTGHIYLRLHLKIFIHCAASQAKPDLTRGPVLMGFFYKVYKPFVHQLPTVITCTTDTNCGTFKSYDSKMNSNKFFLKHQTVDAHCIGCGREFHLCLERIMYNFRELNQTTDVVL